MCLAIYKPPSVVIPEEHLRAGWIANCDGGGFAFIQDDNVEIRKGFMTLKDFMAAYKLAADSYPSSPFLIHFRIRSMGARDQHNTHPYRLPDGGAIIHNGTLTGTGAEWDKGDSDTQLFVRQYGESLTFDIVNELKDDLEAALDYNKLAMLWPDGRHIILNEQVGQWEGGAWYSNGTFKPRPHGAPSIVDQDWNYD